MEHNEERRIGCAHYKRRAKFVTPCCNKQYICRFCHDENEDHKFNRNSLAELICTECDTRQKIQAECEKCGVKFGNYSCLLCNLFDDEDKQQFHCDGCGVCRIGGRERYFHCEGCNMCLPIQLQRNGHKCVENVSRRDCLVCLKDIHTSRLPCYIPGCGHLLHRPCFDQLLITGQYACPTCKASMIDLPACNSNRLWTTDIYRTIAQYASDYQPANIAKMLVEQTQPETVRDVEANGNNENKNNNEQQQSSPQNEENKKCR